MAETHSTCRIDDCDITPCARGWCNAHYKRWKRHGDPLAGGSTRQRGRVCDIEACGLPHEARGYCQVHYNRWLSTGNPLRPCATCGIDVVKLGDRTYCSDDCTPACRIDGCGRKVQAGQSVCPTHHAVIRRNGGNDPAYTWAKEKRCVVCGATEWVGKGRKFCSGKCQQLYARAGGKNVPKATDCVRCGDLIDLFDTFSKSGRKKRADSLICAWCRKARHTRHKVSVSILLKRDGDSCGICREPIDLGLPFPHRLSVTVDHRIPYALGGSHDADNLQLAHWACNSTKQARIGWTPALSD